MLNALTNGSVSLLDTIFMFLANIKPNIFPGGFTSFEEGEEQQEGIERLRRAVLSATQQLFTYLEIFLVLRSLSLPSEHSPFL